MAIATKTKPKAVHHKKRTAGHHRQSKHYAKAYWPYLPAKLRKLLRGRKRLMQPDIVSAD